MKKQVLFNFIFLVLIQILLFSAIFHPPTLFDGTRPDESVYANISRNWNSQGFQSVVIQNDNKPVPFLYLEKVLKADESTFYTRLFNLILIGVNCFLLFKLTKRGEAFIFILIPMFLNTLWLTVEIIESFFILLSLYYNRYSGIFIGFATLFRPYAILYTLLLKKNQYKYVLGIGVIYSLFLLSQGIFFQYLFRVSAYAMESRLETDYYGLVLLILLAIIGSKNKELFKYGIIGCIPLVLRIWNHYMITPYTLFLLSFLSEDKKE